MSHLISHVRLFIRDKHIISETATLVYQTGFGVQDPVRSNEAVFVLTKSLSGMSRGDPLVIFQKLGTQKIVSIVAEEVADTWVTSPQEASAS